MVRWGYRHNIDWEISELNDTIFCTYIPQDLEVFIVSFINSYLFYYRMNHSWIFDHEKQIFFGLFILVTLKLLDWFLWKF